ncbi:Protein kinase-like domain protein [Tolypocladium capitatum]|uniref:EKC/KEOPS complex subunit BUD32 n=1 Tax=Tolypocladium capitatum TaxID=45235 RepID=A0A2K3PYN0_9HYPO|nr:Protein kinase-like domain protein [Tolypocladium capitatum]
MASVAQRADASRPRSPSPELPDAAQPSPRADAQDPSPAWPYHRRTITHIPVPGDWQRKLHPHWPESAFVVPNPAPEGYIYFVTKGDYVRSGSTALVERLPSGDIVKTPTTNPYWPVEEERARQGMEHEHDVYVLLGSNSFIPKLIDRDSVAKTLVIEDLPNGDLEMYVREHRDVDAGTRRKWALQASQALQSLHAAVVVHQDVTPRNFLLDKHLDLRICDFAGSSYPGHTIWTVAPGARYQSHIWARNYNPAFADDIFSLGSVLYFIAAGEEPYSDLEEEEVERRFENRDFPASDQLDSDTVIQGCWNGRLSTTEEVVDALIQFQGD